MDRSQPRIALGFLLTAMCACSTVYLPQDEPLTESTLREAIETLHDSDGRIELLEDGMVVDLYVYEWRRVETSEWRDSRDFWIGDDFGSEPHYQRRLMGPKRDVFLPYASILAVRAHSWSLWSGIELELDSTFQLRETSLRHAPPLRSEGGGPVVIKARDEEDAERLSEAIDRVRRARLPPPEPAEADGTDESAKSPAVPAASEAGLVGGAGSDAAAQ